MPNSHGLGISKGSKNPELAWEFVSFITEHAQAMKFATDRRVLTGNIGVDAALVALLDKEDPLGAAVLRTQVEYTNRMTGNWPLRSIAHHGHVLVGNAGGAARQTQGEGGDRGGEPPGHAHPE